jgi:hypothetical protein
MPKILENLLNFQCPGSVNTTETKQKGTELCDPTAKSWYHTCSDKG